MVLTRNKIKSLFESNRAIINYSVTEEELWDILGQFAPMKKAVILKLCNDSNYQGFMDSYFQKQKEYFDEDPEDIDNIRYYNASKELKQVLDNTEPIYNV